MTKQPEKIKPARQVITIHQMELSTLVGREVVLFTDQFKGKPLKSKVILVNESKLSIDRSGSAGLVERLTDNQKVVVQFDYKGQRISVDASIERSSGGRCNIILDEQAMPLTRRKYNRFDMSCQVKCAVLPQVNFKPQKMSRLRWVEVDSLNFSSGGILIPLSIHITKDTYLLLNIETEDFNFPSLVIGQVKCCYPIDNFKYNIGVEFITNEEKRKHFTSSIIKKMPPVVFEYSATQRLELDRKLLAKMLKNMKKGE